jgi:DNA N-6-adenine-methyltransferase (Dam)
MTQQTLELELTADEVAEGTTDEWYTPRWLFDAAGVTFTMDVASPLNPDHRTVPALRYLTILDDGLVTPWLGTVWCNPPYSKADPCCWCLPCRK